MNEIQVINEQKVLGKDFKMYGTYEEPLFLAKDVANWIEYSKDSKGNYNVSAMLLNIDDNEKIKINTNLNNAKVGSNTWFLTENGLYEVLMQSRKPIAKEFKKEVKKILKSIRKHGAYMTTDTIKQLMCNPDFLIELLTALKSEQDKSRQKDIIIAQLQPKAISYDMFLNSKGYVSLNKAAKSLHKNRNKMMKFLREQGILFKDENDNIAYQPYCNNGCFTVNYSKGKDGKIHGVTKVSSKGIAFIKKLYDKVETKNVDIGA